MYVWRTWNNKNQRDRKTPKSPYILSNNFSVEMSCLMCFSYGFFFFLFLFYFYLVFRLHLWFASILSCFIRPFVLFSIPRVRHDRVSWAQLLGIRCISICFFFRMWMWLLFGLGFLFRQSLLPNRFIYFPFFFFLNGECHLFWNTTIFILRLPMV